MKKLFIAILFPALIFTKVIAQTDTLPIVAKYTAVMIPMRDGVKLYTVIVTPVDLTTPGPIGLFRTPYGPRSIPSDSVLRSSVKGQIWFFQVFQDIRGRNNSEGQRQLHQPIIHATQKGAVDESTDTWDTIDWLVKNLKGHNGRVSLTGTSYPGWLALVGAIDPHPALKSVVEHACMADLWLGDDFYHNGAFRLSYAFEYTYMMEIWENFKFPQLDLYNWYLDVGPLKNINEKYLHGNVPAWNDFVMHPNYDSFWKKNSPLNYMSHPQVPILHQGGYYDGDDLNGPQLMYHHLEKKDSFNRNYLLLGPWNHNGVLMAKENNMGGFSFNPRPFEDSSIGLLRRWNRHWLLGTDTTDLPEATCFQTGSNVWKSYDEWPPKNITAQKLYAQQGNKCSFDKPKNNKGSASYISDPAKPIPYRPLPIDGLQSDGWVRWMVEDQRFVTSRPDVVSFTSDSLTEDLTVTGKIIAHLFASTTGTDADWVVKLIDVYPDNYQSNPKMSGYQFPVAMEVFRGRFRKSFSNPSPLIPDKPEEFAIDLHDINHVFKKGHKLMIQVQSSWFPVIDRNPQKYVPNIFLADESDFIKAEHKIYFSKKYPTYIELQVMKE